MQKIIHLSDLHITPNHSRTDRARAAVAHIISTHSPSDTHVLITGDVIEAPFRARLHEYRKEFELALQVLRPLTEAGFKVSVVPGNHDTARQGVFVSRDMRVLYARFARALCGYELEPHKWRTGTQPLPYLTFPDTGWAFFLADTTVKTLKQDGPFDFARGGLGDEQLHDIRVFLDTYSEWHTGVAGHHGPYYRAWTNRLTDADKLKRCLSRGGAKLFLNGHKHEVGTHERGQTAYLRTHQATTADYYHLIELYESGRVVRKEAKYI